MRLRTRLALLAAVGLLTGVAPTARATDPAPAPRAVSDTQMTDGVTTDPVVCPVWLASCPTLRDLSAAVCGTRGLTTARFSAGNAGVVPVGGVEVPGAVTNAGGTRTAPMPETGTAVIGGAKTCPDCCEKDGPTSFKSAAAPGEKLSKLNAGKGDKGAEDGSFAPTSAPNK